MATPLPPEMERALRMHVRDAVGRLDPKRYRHEAGFVAAVFAKLDDVIYKGVEGTLEIQSTIVTDRGRKSAESLYGADFGVTAIIERPSGRVEKAVLGQAKRGSLIQPRLGGLGKGLVKQCVKMSQITSEMVGLGVPERLGEPVTIREIRIFEERASAFEHILDGRDTLPAGEHIVLTQDVAYRIGRERELGDYLAERFLPCDHGDTNPEVVSRASDSSLPHATIYARTFD